MEKLEGLPSPRVLENLPEGVMSGKERTRLHPKSSERSQVVRKSQELLESVVDTGLIQKRRQRGPRQAY